MNIEQTIRLECLKLAVGQSLDETLARAKRFTEFVLGDEGQPKQEKAPTPYAGQNQHKQQPQKGFKKYADKDLFE